MKERFLETQCLRDLNPHGILTIWEEKANIPFSIKRVFTVVANAGGLRGEHAHKKCQQAIFCVAGQVMLSCDDGIEKRDYHLEPNDAGILIPNGIWAEQRYLEDLTMILVLCDQPYEESDYIRDYAEFLNWKKERN